MAVRVGLKRLWRIGRQVLKAIREKYPNTLEVVAINDIGDLKTMAHLLKYDLQLRVVLMARLRLAKAS